MALVNVVIVGGGVIGLSGAYQLARSGQARVTVIEKDKVGSGSSRRAAGITTGLLWSETGVKARQIGIEWFGRLSRELPGYHYYDEHGCLNLFTADTWPARQGLLAMYDRVGAKYNILKAQEIHQRWPALTPREDMLGLHDPTGGYSEPPVYVAALAKRLGEMGVRIIEGRRAEQFIMKGGSVAGVRAGGETFEADVVVSSVHAWSLAFWEQLGLRLPMKNFVHQRYLSRPLARAYVAPPVNADPYLGYIRPAEGGRVLMGVETSAREEFDVTRVDFRMEELSAEAGLAQRTAQGMSELAAVLKEVEWEAQEVGLISFSMDGEPILGPVGRLPGLIVAGTFHSGGFSYNTAVGVLLSELVLGRKTSVDISSFSPDRFEAAAVEEYLGTKVTQASAVKRRH